MPQTPQYQLGYAAGRASLLPVTERLRGERKAARYEAVGLRSDVEALTLERDGLQSDLADLQTAFDALQAEFDAYKIAHP